MRGEAVYDSAARGSPVIEELVALVRYRDLVLELIARTLKTRYKRSILGVAWTMINPLLTMTVLTLVFSQLFRSATANYALYVLSGLLFWNFISQSTQAAMGELYWSGGLIQRMYLPKSAFAVAAIASAMVNYVVALLPFVLISSALGSLPSPAVLLLPIPLLFAGLFALGVGLAVSSWAMFFADVIPTYEVLLTVWLYLTPIIYPMDVLPAAIQRVLFLNPLTHLLAPFRDILLNGVAPSLSSVALAGALGLLSAAIGWLIFTRRSREYAHVV